ENHGTNVLWRSGRDCEYSCDRTEHEVLEVCETTMTVACPDCDLLQRLPEPPRGSKVRCPRCGTILATRPADPIGRPLALAAAAAIVFIVANTSPLMGLSAVGPQASTTIGGGGDEMWGQGW